MIDGNALLEELIKTGTPAPLVAQVAILVVEAAALRSRRGNDAERSRRSYHARISREKVESHVRPREERKVFPEPLSKEKIKPKRVLSIARELPSDFQLTEADRAFARKHGWDEQRIDYQFDRFRDHAAANGRKQVDWHAAWRKWVTSPYQVNGNDKPQRKSVVDVLADLGPRTDEDTGWLLPEG